MTTTGPATTDRTHAARAARVATGGGFAAQGLAYAVVLTSVPAIKDRLDIGDGVVTGFILGVCVMAALGTGVADRLARTAAGSRAALTAGLVVVAAGVGVIAVAPDLLVAALGFVLYGLGLGLVDAGTNMQAVALQHVYGRSLLAGCYASWSAAGIVGAVLVAVSGGRWPTAPVHVVLLAGVLGALGAAALVARSGWRGSGAGSPLDPTLDAVLDPAVDPAPAGAVPARDVPAGAPAGVRIPWGAVLVLGLGVVAYFVADSAVSSWSTVYLADGLGASAGVAPLGYAAYLATTLASRLGGDRAVERWGRARVVRASGLVGALGLLLAVVAPGTVTAVVGFALTGAGLGVLAPLCFAAAGALAPGQADAVVARLNVFNYVGAVLGGVLVGAIGTASNLHLGFVVPAVLVLAVVAVAGRFGGRTT